MRFHSPDVAEQVVQHRDPYYSIRQGAARCIVILFSDIRGYTSMSEQLTAIGDCVNLGSREMVAPKGLDHFKEGMHCYRQGRFSDARSLFELAAADGLSDFLTDVFIQSSADLIEQAPTNWDGVYTMTKK